MCLCHNPSSHSLEFAKGILKFNVKSKGLRRGLWGWNKNGPQAHMFECFVTNEWNTLEGLEELEGMT